MLPYLLQKTSAIYRAAHHVLLKNGDGDGTVLPLSPQQNDTLYVIEMDKDIVAGYGFKVITGNRAKGGSLPAIPAQVDKAIIRIVVNNPYVNNPYVEERRFGGATAAQLDALAFSDMARADT